MTLKILVVGFHGPAFSGKDACCEILGTTACMGGTTGVFEKRFAGPIYQMIHGLEPKASSTMPKEEKERARDCLGGLSVRQMAIAIGEGARKYDKRVWINLWEQEMKEHVEIVAKSFSYLENPYETYLFLVPDLRKPDEEQALAELPNVLRQAAERHFGTVPGAVEVQSVLIHVAGVNAPVNGQYDPVTETSLMVKPNDLTIVNDHTLGLEALKENLMGAFELSKGHPAYPMFQEFFKVGLADG